MRNPIYRLRVWKKIVYFSHKSVAVRMLSIVFVAAYLLIYHSLKSTRDNIEIASNNFTLKKVVAVAMSLSLIFTGVFFSSINVLAEEEVASDTEEQVEVDEENSTDEDSIEDNVPAAESDEQVEEPETPSEPQEQFSIDDSSNSDESENEKKDDSNTDSNIVEEVVPESTEDKDTTDKDETVEEDALTEVGEEEQLEETELDAVDPELEPKELSGGFYQDEIYYSNSEIDYSFEVKNEDCKTVVVCTTVDGEPKFEDIEVDDEHVATWKRTESYNGEVAFGYKDENDQFIEEEKDKFILDLTIPEIEYELPEDDSGYISITADDIDEYGSGVNEIQAFVDGMMTDIEISEEQLEEGKVTGTIKASAGEHELELYVSDIAGNATLVTENINIKKKAIVSVVAPTMFNMKMLETGEDNEIISSNVAICNSSEVPVEVKIDSIVVEVNRDNLMPGQTKSCEIDLELSIAGQEVTIYNCKEGVTTDIPSIKLEPKNENTDTKALFATMQEADMKILPSESSDYAVIRFAGNFSSDGGAKWTDNDIKVHINYTVTEISE